MIVITGNRQADANRYKAGQQDNRLQDTGPTGYRIQDTHAKTGPRPLKWVINTQCVKVVIEFHFQ